MITTKYFDSSTNFIATLYTTNSFLSNSFFTNRTDKKFWDKKLKIHWVDRSYANQKSIFTKNQSKFDILWDSANISFTCSTNWLKTEPWQIAYVRKWCNQNYNFTISRTWLFFILTIMNRSFRFPKYVNKLNVHIHNSNLYLLIFKNSDGMLFTSCSMF